MTHELKIWPEHFKAVVSGVKTFELRKWERPYKVGDKLVLREWDPVKVNGVPLAYTGQSVAVRVTYILKPGVWGLPADLGILGIRLETAAPPLTEITFLRLMMDATRKRQAAYIAREGASGISRTWSALQAETDFWQQSFDGDPDKSEKGVE